MPQLRLRFLIIAILLCFIPGLHAAEKAPKTAPVKNLPPGQNILWQDPGDVASLDLVYGVGGREGMPQEPFQFLSEDSGGTTPKVKVRDGAGRTWVVKFGAEAKPSTMATRLVWACGYPVETEYLFGHGHIVGARHLKRAKSYIQGDGSFVDGRFQLRSDKPKFLTGANWTWSSNPFLATPELNGLKVLAMLVSNWDTKDARDFDPGSGLATADSNLGIFQAGTPEQPVYLYLMTDWGASFGKWGPPVIRNKWNCRDYANQTADFVQGVDNGILRFGYVGKHNPDLVNNIRVSDVQWLLQYLGKITDEQFRRGLAASGATPEELECYLNAIRARINLLSQAVTPK